MPHPLSGQRASMQARWLNSDATDIMVLVGHPAEQVRGVGPGGGLLSGFTRGYCASELTMDVGAWLRSLGLGRYEQAFRANEIDDSVLPNLTTEDLRDMGVGPVG